MKPISKFLAMFAATLVAATTLFAKVGGGASPAPGPQAGEVGLGGLQTALTTGGYRFVVGETAGTAALNTFPASACLQNRSPFDIKFAFPTVAEAERKFTFRIFDHDGTKVWESDSEVVSPEVLTDATLGKFQRWKRTIPIPLKPGGTPLAAGIYTLEASIDADKQLGATAVFEVISAPDPTTTGIRGLVLKADSVAVDGGPAPTESPAANALIVINEIITTNVPGHAPFNWAGHADNDGRFSTSAPAGHYRVTASYVAPAPGAGVVALVYPPKIVEVTVTEGAFSELTIHLAPVATPPQVQGIHGHVLIGTGTGAETALAGALVTIDQVNTVAGNVPFHWQGVAGTNGGFEVPTPVGSFHVTAAAPANSPAGTPAPVSVDVSVAAGAFSEVTFHLVATPPQVQGIHGHVLIGTGTGAETALAGALVTIDQVTDGVPFHWQGVAGTNGGFEVPTPVGNFHLTAAPPANSPAGAPAPVSVNVSVAAGAFSEVTLHLVATPPQVQGIHGRVLIATGIAEVPLAGANVTIDQLNTPTGAVPFHWQGASNIEGRFNVPTPAGHFRVTAAATNVTSQPAIIETDVAAGAYAEVVLHIAAGPLLR